MTTISAQITPQGLLIPREALGDWRLEELEVIQERDNHRRPGRPGMTTYYVDASALVKRYVDEVGE